MSNSKGSEWRKWDLHMHSPYTNMNSYSSSNDEFINKIKSENISVIGLTNYFKFADEEFDLKDELENKGVTVFLNLEIRLEFQNNADDCLDLHIIFSNHISNESIKRFTESLKVNVQGSDKRCNDLETNNDFKYAVVDFKHLLHTLNDSSLGLNKEYLIGFLSRGKGNGRSSSVYERLTQESDLIIHSTDKSDNIVSDKNFWLKFNKPLLQSSDAHSLGVIGEKFTWIKADLTFEGLKQITHEPNERVKIQENKPFENLTKIEEVELKFRDDMKIMPNGGNTAYPFCFSDVKTSLYLSDYFTCIIGGRGSGKSSLLNLIYWKITGKKDTNFLANNTISNLEIDEDIKIAYQGEVEFLGQNQIEEFATDYIKFSKAIYERLENREELINNSFYIDDEILSLDDDIGNIKEVQKNNKLLFEINKKLETYQTVVNVIQGEEYNSLKKELDILSADHYKLEESKNNFEKISKELNGFIGKFSKKQNEENLFDEKYNQIINKLQNLKDEVEVIDFSKIEEEQKEILQKGKKQKEKLAEYLVSKGMSLEKSKNLEEAQEGLNKGKIEKEKIEKELKELNLCESCDFEEFNIRNEEYKKLVENGLKKAAEELNEKKNKDVERLDFKVNLNIERAKEDLLKEFIDNVFSRYKNPGLREGTIEKSLLSDTEQLYNILNGNITYEKFHEYINSLEGKNNKFLKEIFEVESNFEIYKIMLAKYLYNLNGYLKIDIFYDNRPIESSSFGQKCTVVILIMLLFGTNPIIIDEPEAHLDSSLIANYLVDLIKERKKDRQIIFATHNANFVINGDAEQIYILDNIQNKTSFTQTTIENLEHREKLLKLEGGEEAFKLRGRRYSNS